MKICLLNIWGNFRKKPNWFQKSNWLNIFTPKGRAQKSVPVGTARDGLLLQGQEGSAGCELTAKYGERLMEKLWEENMGNILEIVEKTI